MLIIPKKGIRGMIYMWKKVLLFIGIIIIVAIGITVGINLYSNNKDIEQQNTINNKIENENNNEIYNISNTIATSNKEEKTTPNTLMIYKTYYTKCNHYINEYKDIDISDVNLTEDEIQNKNREWTINEFSSEQVIFEKESEEFCNQHYKLKLIDNRIVIFNISEDGEEKEYKRTEISSEYLTQEDLLRLKEGITVYGKENLTSVLEDYE